MSSRFLAIAIVVALVAACTDQGQDPVAAHPEGLQAAFSTAFEDQGTGEEELDEHISFVAPSTNALNRDRENPIRPGQAAPYVVWADVEVGEITLRFVDPTDFSVGGAFFEVRIDGETVGETDHPIVNTGVEHPATGEPALIDDVIHPGIALPAEDPDAEVIETFEAEATVEVRLALGPERDFDFDWTVFHVPSTAEARDACKDGGWQELGFANQGRCIQYMNTGKDSR